MKKPDYNKFVEAVKKYRNMRNLGLRYLYKQFDARTNLERKRVKEAYDLLRGVDNASVTGEKECGEKHQDGDEAREVKETSNGDSS